MIIKRWNGTAFVAESPKTTFTDIVADVTAATPVSIFSGGKLKEEYLPNSVFSGLTFVGTLSISGSPSSPMNLNALINATVFSGYAVSTNLDTFTGKVYANGDFASIGQRYIGHYWILTSNFSMYDQTGADQVDWDSAVFDEGVAPALVGGLYPDTIALEAGDWVVITDWDNATSKFKFRTISNTVGQATSFVSGVVKLGSSTAQTVAANAVSATADRTYASQLNSDGQLVVNVPWVDTNTTYSEATTTTLGLVELAFAKSASSPTLTESTTANRFYGVSLNSGSQMQVNVPWTDTTYSAGTGLTLSGTTFSHTDTSSATNLTAGTRTYVTGLTFDTFGHVTGYTTGQETVVDTNTTYGIATSTVAGLVEVFSDTDQSVAANAVTTTAGRTYGIQLNSADQAVVNVPWTDTTYSKATATTLGLVELFDATVQSVAANSVSTTASRTYGIQLNSADQMVVNVPWTDNNTTYSAGNGISLSSTTFSVAAGVGLTQEASGLKMTQPFISSATAPGASFQVTDNIWFDIA